MLYTTQLKKFTRWIRYIFLILPNVIFSEEVLLCTNLLPGQYRCDFPKIDEITQQPVNCSHLTLTAQIDCRPAPGIICNGILFSGREVGFQKPVPCLQITGYRFDIALLLSVFGGFFGLDRFYLGYPALGCIKLFTIGGFGLWYLTDILLISIGTFGPSDGSSLHHPYYDPSITLLQRTNFTVYVG